MIAEGEYNARPKSASVGTDKNGNPVIKIQFLILDGEYSGQSIGYQNRLDGDGLKYAKSAAQASGWDGRNIADAPAQIVANCPSTVIRTAVVDGPKPWAKVKFVGPREAALPPLTQAQIDAINGAAVDEDSVPF